MAFHAKYALRCPCIFEIFYLPFAIPALEAICTESLVAREDSQVLDFVIADTAAVCAIVADE